VEGSGQGLMWNYPSVCSGRPRKITKQLSQDGQWFETERLQNTRQKHPQLGSICMVNAGLTTTNPGDLLSFWQQPTHVCSKHVSTRIATHQTANHNFYLQSRSDYNEKHRLYSTSDHRLGTPTTGDELLEW